MDDKEFLSHLKSEFEYALEENRDNVALKGKDIDHTKMYNDLKFEDFLPGAAGNKAPERDTEQKNKGGARKGALTEAIEYAYKKFKEEGNTEILRKGKIRDFLVRLKELADEKGNPNFSKDIADRIKSVKLSPSGCIVTTEEQFIESSNIRENKMKCRNFKQQRVSQILSELRKEFPIVS